MVEIIASLFVYERYRRIYGIEDLESVYMLMLVILVQSLVFIYLYSQDVYDLTKLWMVGPMVVISLVDAMSKYIYDLDILFIFILQFLVGVAYASTDLYSFDMSHLVQIWDLHKMKFLSSILIFILTLILSKRMGAMGQADPYLYFGASLSLGLYKTMALFFVSNILALMYVIVDYVLCRELENKIALGPFICMAYLIV